MANLSWLQRQLQNQILLHDSTTHLLDSQEQNDDHTMSYTTSQDRSRKRTRRDGPDIPGLPIDVAPFLVAAISETTMAFQHSPTIGSWIAADSQDESKSDSKNRRTHTTTNPLEHVLDRFKRATESREERQTQQPFLDRMKTAIESWENILKRNSKTTKKVHNDPISELLPQRHYQSIPMVSFLYIWNLQNHSQIPVRRASLHLASNLLGTNEECRNCWKEDHLFTWVKYVVKGESLAQCTSQVSLWQSEARSLLSGLVNTCPDAQIRVGLRFLQQRCPRDTSEDINKKGTSPTIDLRHIRDFALRYGEREIEICEKLLKRAHKCIDFIMPRFAAVTTDLFPRQQKDNIQYHEDEDADDDDVDWEEGDVGVSEGVHIAAVEQTLAVMQSTGELRGGDLEFDVKPPDAPSQTEEGTEQFKIRLTKVNQSLSTTHMTRLSSWVHALTNADNLVQPPGEVSLIAMSANVARKRSNLLHQLLDLKSNVSSLLASSSKLHAIQSNQFVTCESTRPSQKRILLQPLVGLSDIPRPYDDLTRSNTHYVRKTTIVKPLSFKKVRIKFKKQY